MSNGPDLRCTQCGKTAGYADAVIADNLRTCPGEDGNGPAEPTHETVIRGGTETYTMHRQGVKHDWVETDE